MLVLDDNRYPPVQLGAAGPQLRFVGHGADQWMPERVFRARRKTYLVDELASLEFGDGGPVLTGLGQDGAQQIEAEPGTDDGAGVQRMFGRRAEAVDAGGDSGLQCVGHAEVGAFVPADVVAAIAS